MNKQLQDFLLASLIDIKEFSSAQLPDIAYQILHYNFWFSLIFFCIGICLIIIAIFISMRMIKKNIDEFNIAICLIFFVLIIAPLIYLNLDWLKIWLAPKLYLLEYARRLR